MTPGARPVSALRNIGPRSAAWLREAGIATEDGLRAVGPVAAYARVKATRPREASLNLLWSLQAALLDISWAELPDTIKDALKRDLTA